MKFQAQLAAALMLAAGPAWATGAASPAPATATADAPKATAETDAGQPPADFRPESLTIIERIPEGPNVFVSQEALTGPSTIAVIGQEDLKIRNLLPTGSQNQMFVTPDGKTVRTQSTYLKRMVSGDLEQVLQTYDVATGAIAPEIALPPKAAMALTYPSYLRETADGSLMLVQNATPASSITVVDLAGGTIAQEIPTPGCFGIFPTAEGAAFDTLCGDGSMARYTLTEKGAKADKADAKGIFDPTTDPLFIEGARLGADWLFVSYKGRLVRLASQEGVAASVAEVDLPKAAGAADWAPSGYSVLTANDAHGWAFVGMHGGAYDGSHKNPMAEVWTVDVAKGEVVARSPVGPLASIAVTQGDSPLLFATSVDGKLMKYTVGSDGKLTEAGSRPLTGFAISLAVGP